jgi:predicted amidohydrolase
MVSLSSWLNRRVLVVAGKGLRMIRIIVLVGLGACAGSSDQVGKGSEVEPGFESVSAELGAPTSTSIWRPIDEAVRNKGLPRKVLVGTVIQPFWDKPATLDQLLEMIERLIDSVAEEAERKYPDSSLDLVVLPEGAITAGDGPSAAEVSVRLEGLVLDRMGGKARQHGTYLIVPMFLVDDETKGVYSNAAVLLDRKGDAAGIYRKVHPVANLGGDVLEGGVMPGADYPVFECDFGRIGIQICWDLSYDEGWRSLARKGAEIVALPSESPQTVRPAYYASSGRYYVVSSTPHNNASIFNPAGMVEAQITEKGVLVHQIDLSFLVLPWSRELRKGKAFSERFGGRVGYHYYESEDAGLFWSNDPRTSISEMTETLGLVEFDWRIKRTQILQDRARGKQPEVD